MTEDQAGKVVDNWKRYLDYKFKGNDKVDTEICEKAVKAFLAYSYMAGFMLTSRLIGEDYVFQQQTFFPADVGVDPAVQTSPNSK